MNKNKRSAAIGTVALTILIIAIYVAMILTDETVLLPRPESWAQPMEMEGVINLCKLSDDLYRSGQPTAEGMVNLEEMGVKTIVNLRFLNSDRERLEGTGLGYVHINMEAWDGDQEEAVEFLRVVSDPDRVPVLVHCSYGADRTGAMCAVYRIAVQGWSKEEAIREMTQGGFGFHPVWTNLAIWIRALDIDEIRTQAGMNQSTHQAVGQWARPDSNQGPTGYEPAALPLSYEPMGYGKIIVGEERIFKGCDYRPRSCFFFRLNSSSVMMPLPSREASFSS